jgi:oxygen-dependent protoporphyrinogen oxidase
MRIAIIGAGLTGLVVAFRRAAAGDAVILLDAAERAGGQIHSERTAGYVVEHGAEGYVARSDAVQALAGELGIADRVREQLTQRSYGFDGAALLALEPGEAARFLGFQVPRDELGRGIRSFAAGMQELTDALMAALPQSVELRLASNVTSVTRTTNGLTLTAEGAPPLAVERVVVATTAARAAALLEPACGAPAAALAFAPTLSSVTVSLAFARDQVGHALDGTGFVVAEAAQREGFRACTFVSSKFAGRAPADRALIRLFFRPTSAELSSLSDADYVSRATRRLGAVIPLEGPPERSWVSRWPNALPVHSDDHRAIVEGLEAALAGGPITLAGAAFHGSGIDAAVRSAERVARELG